MHKYLITLLAFVLMMAIACSKESGASSTSKGVKYTIHTNKGGTKPKVGDFLTLNMQYATEKDSLLFSSYKKEKPLSFKMQPTLFKGVLNDGLLQMGAGDSATFFVPADTLYGDRLPKFLKKGERIKYTISLIKVQTQAEYQDEKMKERAANPPTGRDTMNRPALKLNPDQLKKATMRPADASAAPTKQEKSH